MKKVLVILVALCFIGVAQADITVNGVDPGATWNGYMNVFDTPANGGGYMFGSAWGTADLRANFGSDLLLQANTNTYDDNPLDPYWVDQGTLLGNKDLEANFYREWFGGLSGTVTFNYEVLSNNLAAAGYATQAFIKVLDPDSGWATVQSTFLDLTSGAGSINLTINPIATPVTQVGFVVKGLNVSGASAEALLGVVIVPEPMTIGLLGLGGLFLRRRK